MPLDVDRPTDPACPFASSAEPVRQRLRRHDGDGPRRTVPIDPRPSDRPASSEPAGADGDWTA